MALAGVTLTALCLTSCMGKGKKQKYNEGTAVMYCDEGFASFMEEEIGVFEYQYPKATILTRYMSENEAIQGLLDDSCQLIVTATPLTKDQIDYVKDKNNRIVKSMPIAVDAVALIVNKNNSVSRLTTVDIQDILTGKVKEWGQLQRVTDNKLDTTGIKIVFDRPGSATVNYMQQRFLNGGKFPANAYAQQSSEDVFSAVEKDPSAIGIISVGWLGENLEKLSSDAIHIDEAKVKGLADESEIVNVDFTDKVKVLAIGSDKAAYVEDYYLPSQTNIWDKYPLVRKIYMTTSSMQTSVGQSFYSFVTSVIGQKILARTGILPYSMPVRVVELE